MPVKKFFYSLYLTARLLDSKTVVVNLDQETGTGI